MSAAPGGSMAYSSRFSPHPRLSYANASPTGAASEAEYLGIGLSEECDPAKVQAALPPGLDIVEVVPSPPGALADLLAGSRWAVDLVGAPEEAVQSVVVRLLGTTEVEVERMTKNGLRRFDARPAIFTLGLSTPWPMNPAQDPEPDGAGNDAHHTTPHHTTPAVRPDDVVAALVAVSPDVALEAPPVLTRLAQGVLDPVTRNAGRARPADGRADGCATAGMVPCGILEPVGRDSRLASMSPQRGDSSLRR